jgi:uridine kinase
VKLEPGQILLLDCLHGFYPPITEGIDASAQFRIYIEAMNVLYEGPDGSTKRLTQFTDARLIRRMLRDANTATTARSARFCTGTTSATANCSASSR